MEDVSQNLVQSKVQRNRLAEETRSHVINNKARVKLIQDGRRLAYLVLAASAIGQGARMLYQGIMVPGSSYIPNGLDLAFDWGILLVLGSFVLVDQLVKGHSGASA